MKVVFESVPCDLKPRERFKQVGPTSLSDVELLAIFLRTGSAQENVLQFSESILCHFNGLQGLKEASLEELKAVHGLGEVKSIEIQGMIELGKRFSKSKRQKLGQVLSSYALGQDLILEMKDLQQEHLVGIYLNTKNEIIKKETLFVGSLNQSVAHPREIFKGALKVSAASIIIAHNHPSNHLEPFKQDIHFTKRISEIGGLMGIPVLDHFIIGEEDYLSLKEEGYFTKE